MPAASTPDLWLLTGNRAGEVSQQRALAQAVGLPFLEKRVAELASAGGRARFDTSGLVPPWPRAVVSFGQTLPAAMDVRSRSGGSTRVVQIGRPRHVPWRDIDLILPLPQDVMRDAPNLLRLRMPLNLPRTGVLPVVADALHRASLPRPWSLLVIGGVTRQYRFDQHDVRRLCGAACARARAAGGSLLVSTSPRTPPDAAALAARVLDVAHAFYRFQPGDADNPLSTYLHLADEVLLSGDSPSMLAECWRSAKPVWVQPVRYQPRYWLRRHLREWLLPRAAIESGRYPASLDINTWLAALEREGHIGILGRSAPRRTYDPAEDDDLARAASRIRSLIA